MHFIRNKQIAPEDPDLSSAEDSASTSCASSQPSHQNASYRFLDQDRFDISSDIPTSFQHASIPCPQLPISSSNSRPWQISNRAERRNSSGSSSSTGLIRRSVSGMKKLMPLRLQSPPLRPKTDLSSWLKSTASTPHLPTPVLSETELEPTQEAMEANKVPWMWSQGGKLLLDVHPNKYRETPIYSESRSPILSRAYFSEEDLCFKCPPPGSICDELCIVSDYEEEDWTDSQSQASSRECPETFDQNIEDCVDTSRTSMISSRCSGLSIKCQGELSTASENESSMTSSTSHTASQSEDMVLTVADDDSGDGPFGRWLEADSSRSSSPDSLNNEVLSACATPLAPARATMIVVPKSPIVHDGIFKRGLSLPPRPSTPFKARNRRKSSMDGFLHMPPLMSGNENHVLRPRGRLRRPRPALPHLDLKLDVHDSPPALCTPVHAFVSSPSICAKPLGSLSLKEPDTTDGVIEAICDTLSTFPCNMLFLDTPCVQSIRRLNTAHNGNQFAQLSLSPSVLDLCKAEPPPDLRTSRYHRRRSKTTSLFRSKSLKQKLQKQPSDTTSPPSTARSIIDLSTPNLRPLRAIFPKSDDWWRSVLYAHLVAYNFICAPISSSSSSQFSSETSVSSRRIELPNKYNTSPKASRMLGLLLPTTPYLSGREVRLEEARALLESCVARVAECVMIEEGYDTCMAGNRVDLGFVRALAEVVRGCEGLS